MRLTDKETGISASATDSKSQKQNKEQAFYKLIEKLIVYYSEQEVGSENERLMNLGWAEKIRTYNEPRNEVIDHRNNKKARMSDVLNGDIEKLH